MEAKQVLDVEPQADTVYSLDWDDGVEGTKETAPPTAHFIGAQSSPKSSAKRKTEGPSQMGATWEEPFTYVTVKHVQTCVNTCKPLRIVTSTVCNCV